MTDSIKAAADTGGPEQIRTAALAFVGAAFIALARENVLPTPRVHPYIKVGRDYFGGDVMPLAEFAAFEQTLHDVYPGRFADPLRRHHDEFPNAYIFSFLEACVSRCGIEGVSYDVESPPVARSVTELIDVLDSDEYEVICCREVSHLTTTDGKPLQLGGVVIMPGLEQVPGSGLVGVASGLVPGTIGAFNRDEPRIYDPPKSMVVVRAKVTDVNPFSVAARLSAQVDRFLLLCRLLHAATAQSRWQVCGVATLVARMSPIYTRYGKAGFMGPLVRRTTRLASTDEAAFKNLGAMIDEAVVKREGMITTPFDMALDRFARTYQSDSPFDCFVDLATALEATLTGNDQGTEAISLRLKSRAAALLLVDGDPASAIFNDIGSLYGLRSTLVHGGSIKETKLRREISRVTTVQADAPFGQATAHAVDRMRDIVRRAFLARLCLAEAPDPTWPFEAPVAVDSILSDDDQRTVWRDKWRSRMSEIGAASAADPARPGADFISPDDR
jgi:hypothetical protein